MLEEASTAVRRVLARRLWLAPLLALTVAGPATACIQVGAYRDDPRTLTALDKRVGRGVSVVSTYVTIGKAVDPNAIKVAKARRGTLMVTLMIDDGTDRTNQPRFSNAMVASGRYDGAIRRLGRQLRATGLNVLLRPMPEPNTQFWAWSGTVNGNTPESYVKAWKRVRFFVKSTAGSRTKILWAPYARSVPDTDDNALDRYFPGEPFVDQVGVSGYNFGAVGELEWLSPLDIFRDPYIAIQNLSGKGFWIAETGTTSVGGSRGAWIRDLASMQLSMPRLRGVVMYDVRDGIGDFRLTVSAASTTATKALLATRCGARKR